MIKHAFERLLVKLSRTVVFKWLQLNCLQFNKTKKFLSLWCFSLYARNSNWTPIIQEIGRGEFQYVWDERHGRRTKNTKLWNKIWIFNGEIPFSSILYALKYLKYIKEEEEEVNCLLFLLQCNRCKKNHLLAVCVRKRSEWKWTHSKLNGNANEAKVKEPNKSQLA